MILQRKRGLQSVLLLAQSLLIVLSFGLNTAVSNLFSSLSPRQIDHYPIYALVMICGLLFESTRRRVHTFEDSFVRQHQMSLNQTFFATGALFFYLVVTRDEFISRISLALYMPVLYITLLWSNRYLWTYLASSLFRGVRQGRVLLIGDPSKAQALDQWLHRKELFGMHVAGILTEMEPSKDAKAIPYMGPPSSAEKVIVDHDITQIIVLQLPDNPETHRVLMAAAESHGVRVLIHNNLGEKLNHPVIYIEDEGHHFISLREEPLESPLNRICKRLLDICIALPVVLFLLPLVALSVWILQRFCSPGPLFFKQVRAGIQNQHFVIWKFRTMNVDNPDATRQVSRDDSRIYTGGRLLRRFSIDELPQFWNVLQGSMSVIGPRPHLIEHNEQFARQIAKYPIRTVVKPGITGLAQVRGFRGETRAAADIVGRVEADITYLENWRLSLDLAIIIRTAWQMIFPPKNAY